MTTVRISHIRKADLCMKGARKWFASHGLSWQDFLDNGISADLVDGLNDPIGRRVTTIARMEDADGR